MMEIFFTVPGSPKGKGRPRFSTAGQYPRAYTPADTAHYENLVKLAAWDEMGGKPPVTGAVSLEVMAFFPIPASWPKKAREAALNGTAAPVKKPDADNIAKIVADALNGIVWRDDAQVVSLHVEKHYGLDPRVEVKISQQQMEGRPYAVPSQN